MPTPPPIFDDISRVANGAFGALSGLRTELEGWVRQHVERVAAGLDMVTREEFQVVSAMASKARQDQAALEARIAQLEAHIAALSPRD
jgi:BMFP domain-containing protein YqiC